MNTQLAQCPHCTKTVTVLKDRPYLRLHGPKRTRCRGSRLDTTGWREVNVPTVGIVLFAPKP